MRVTFGMALDGYSPRLAVSSLGEVFTGPSGLLEILETRLGLSAVRPAHSMRVAQYRQCLSEADDGRRFYSRSFAVDSLAVAETLLGWRDTWVEAGWNGTAEDSNSQRIRDLAVVEVLAQGRLGQGRADRLRAVERTLAARQPGIRELRLIDPIENLPPVWQRFLALLPVTMALVDSWAGTVAPEGSDLALLQDALRADGRPTFRGDGSFLVVEADSDHVLARAVAETLRPDSAQGDATTTLIVGRRGEMLDAGLVALDLPAMGRASTSPWRPATQLLRLALSLLWEPLDPYRLLEFLTHPVCPVRGVLRARLARVVADAPGLGSPAWRKVIDEIRTAAATSGGVEAARAIDEEVQIWLERQRFSALEGAPVSVLVDCCGRVSQWAARRANREGVPEAERAMFRIAQQEASAVAEAIQHLLKAGAPVLTRLELDRIVDQVTARGSVRQDVTAECGHVHVVADPAAVIEAVDRVIWWDFSAPALPQRWPWSSAELDQLRARGADLRSVDSLLQFAASTWLRPVMAAQRQLVLLVPRRQGDEATAAHPLRDRIVAMAVEGNIPVLDLDRVLQHRGASSPQLPLRLTDVPHRRLPAPQRWWQLPSGHRLAARDEESFSSLNSFVHKPHQWVLRYKAGLLPGNLAHIAAAKRQKGVLLHRLMERFFADPRIDWRTADQASVGRWVAAQFPRLLAEEGANYLLPGKQREAQGLQETASSAAWSLLVQLRAAAAVSIRMEQPDTGTFCGGRLGGRIDMLITAADDREAVVDLKGGGFSHRCDELRSNEQLQLAVYAKLRRDATGQWPSQAYFILDEGRLASQDKGFFPGAQVCEPARGAGGTPALWQAFERTWAWRRAQLDQGRIEVIVEGTTPDADSTPPIDALCIAEPNDRFDDYVRLVGWPEEA